MRLVSLQDTAAKGVAYLLSTYNISANNNKNMVWGWSEKGCKPRSVSLVTGWIDCKYYKEQLTNK